MAGVASALIVLVTILKLGSLFQELPKVCYFNVSVYYKVTTVKTNSASHDWKGVMLFYPLSASRRINEAFYNVCFRLYFHRLSLWIWRGCLSSTRMWSHFGEAVKLTWWEVEIVRVECGSVSLFLTLCVPQVVWIVTWVSTLLFNMDLGLAASIIFALLTVIFRTQMWDSRFRTLHCLCELMVNEGCIVHATYNSIRPTYSVLGNIPGTELYLDIETHREVKEIQK